MRRTYSTRKFHRKPAEVFGHGRSRDWFVMTLLWELWVRTAFIVEERKLNRSDETYQMVIDFTFWCFSSVLFHRPTTSLKLWAIAFKGFYPYGMVRAYNTVRTKGERGQMKSVCLRTSARRKSMTN